MFINSEFERFLGSLESGKSYTSIVLSSPGKTKEDYLAVPIINNSKGVAAAWRTISLYKVL